MAAPRASETLMGAMRELVGQSERVARAEARVAASRLRDVARSGARRGLLIAVATFFSGSAVLYGLFAAYLSLATRMVGWQAALVIAASCVVLAMLLLGIASRYRMADVLDDDEGTPGIQLQGSR